MRTLVELYDKEPMENVLGSCIFEPEHVVYLCDIHDSSLRKEKAVYRVFQNRKIKTVPRFYYVDTGNPAAIRRALAAIARDWPGCVFDFTGGKDLVLLITGSFCQKNNLPGYYIDIAYRRFLPILGCEDLVDQFVMPRLRAEDLLGVCGAGILGYGHFPLSEIDEEFERDVFAVWDCVMAAPARWGNVAGYFQAAFRGGDEEQLEFRVPQKIYVGPQSIAKAELSALRRLRAAGILTELECSHDKVAFRVKNLLLKKCLSNHGIWLELYGYLCAKQTGWFDDVRTSLLIDWDGEDTRNGTRNEVDILLLKGMDSVFISCKMGPPSALALAEIKTISDRFGAGRSKTVLLTASAVKGVNRVLSTRAKDMGITLIDRGDLGQKDLGQRLIKICKSWN